MSDQNTRESDRVSEPAFGHRKRSTERKLRTMGRRRLIKTLAGLGVSTAALASGEFEEMASAASDDSSRVVRIHSYQHTNHDEVKKGAKPEREPQYYTIPRDEWVQTEAPYRAASKVNEQIGNAPLVVVRPTIDLNSRNNTEIVVTYQVTEHEPAADAGEQKKDTPGRSSPPVSLQEVRRRAPEKVDGTVTHDGKQRTVKDIPVRVEKRTLTTTSVYSAFYRPVPGGCQIRRGDFGAGTICTPAYDMENSSPGWITAGHVLKRTSGTDAYQPENCCTTLIGESTKYLEAGNGDSGFIASDGENRKLDIADKGTDSYMGWEIHGRLAEDKVKDMAAKGQYIYRQGRTTGRQSVKMKSVSNDPGLVFAGQGEDKGGDSGGPYFMIDNNGGSLIIGNHQGHYSTKSIGTAMFHAEPEMNLVI